MVQNLIQIYCSKDLVKENKRYFNWEKLLKVKQKISRFNHLAKAKVLYCTYKVVKLVHCLFTIQFNTED